MKNYIIPEAISTPTLDSTTQELIAKVPYTISDIFKLDTKIKKVKEIATPILWYNTEFGVDNSNSASTIAYNIFTGFNGTLVNGNVGNMVVGNDFIFNSASIQSINTGYTLNPKTNVTFLATINIASLITPLYKYIFGASGANGLEFRVKGNGVQFVRAGATEFPSTPTNTLSINNYINTAGIMPSTGNWTTIVNNVIANTGSQDLVPYVNSVVRIGNGQDNVPMNGKMKNIMLFNQALTQVQIENLFNIL